MWSSRCAMGNRFPARRVSVASGWASVWVSSDSARPILRWPQSTARTLKGIIVDISELLAFVVKNKASDLHLSSGLPPMIRVHGDIRRINLPAMEHKDVHGMIYDIMNDGQRKHYEENLECDFSFAIPGLARFRVNAFVQQ